MHGTPWTGARSIAATCACGIALSAPGAAQALDTPGGASAPVSAPPTAGTGGTEYRALAAVKRAGAKPATGRATRAPALHEPATRRSVQRKPAPRKPAPRRPAPRKPKSPVRQPAATPTGVPRPTQTLGEGAQFPVLGPHSFGGPENRFGAGRVGHIHEGQDVLASEGQDVVAPLAGTVITTGYQAGGAGWYLAESIADGLSFFYAHCQAGSLAVKAEQRVRAGQQLCQVGQSGDATGPHLHFEVWVGGWRVAHGYAIDPLPYLEAWDR